jgi:hypothetical protein
VETAVGGSAVRRRGRRLGRGWPTGVGWGRRGRAARGGEGGVESSERSRGACREGGAAGGARAVSRKKNEYVVHSPSHAMGHVIGRSVEGSCTGDGMKDSGGLAT